MSLCAPLVAPFAGAWIEILQKTTNIFVSIGRSLRGSVDWNSCIASPSANIRCRSLRGSVDWNKVYTTEFNASLSRSLRGSVGWNLRHRQILKHLLVAPFAGAWIEIVYCCLRMPSSLVAPFAGAWIEIQIRKYQIFLVESLPSRERGLKL